MRYKVTFIAGFAAGFVAGARAGRERYEQIKKLAASVADSPAAQQAAAAVQAKAADAAKTARSKVTGQLQDQLNNAKGKVPGLRGKEPDPAANGHRYVGTAD
jgi:type IV secretory pathway TrbL component